MGATVSVATRSGGNKFTGSAWEFVRNNLDALTAPLSVLKSGQAVLTQIRLPQKPGDPVVAVGRINAPPGPGGRARTFNVWIDPPTADTMM